MVARACVRGGCETARVCPPQLAVHFAMPGCSRAAERVQVFVPRKPVSPATPPPKKEKWAWWVGWWLLVVGGWWLVVGGWWLVVDGGWQ